MKLSWMCFFFLSENAKKVTVKAVRAGSRSHPFFFFFHILKKNQTPRKASFYAFLTRKINTVVFIEER